MTNVASKIDSWIATLGISESRLHLIGAVILVSIIVLLVLREVTGVAPSHSVRRRSRLLYLGIIPLAVALLLIVGPDIPGSF